jgi:polyhydroxybutyrate depolymerase|tara:strand:- start:1210 stop:2181 length:972 start_codon:yes stop_codon:yes gene_type:complete
MKKLKSVSWICIFLVVSSFTGCLDDIIGKEEINNNNRNTGLNKYCIDFDDKERCWLLLVPENIDYSKESPLVIDMHGIGGNMYLQHNLTRFANVSEEHGVYVVYPQGHNNEWNMGDDICCGDDDDFGFILEMIEIIKQKYTVDESRIYSTGWSNGCGMTQRLAAQASEIFAAAACSSMYFMDDPTADYSPIPFMEIHGLVDELVHYPTVSLVGFYYGVYNVEAALVGAIQNFENWADMNGCQGLIPEIIALEEDYDIRAYTDCENGAEVRLMTQYYSSHNPYLNDYPASSGIGRGKGNPTGIPTTEILWDFLNQHSKMIDNDN